MLPQMATAFQKASQTSSLLLFVLSNFSLIKKGVFSKIAKLGRKLNLPKSTRKILYKFAREKDYYNAYPNLARTMQNLIAIDLKDRLCKIKIPTTIIWGEKDRITPLTDARKLHSAIPGSNLVTIKDAGHSPQYTHSNAMVELILKETGNASF